MAGLGHQAPPRLSWFSLSRKIRLYTNIEIHTHTHNLYVGCAFNIAASTLSTCVKSMLEPPRSNVNQITKLAHETAKSPEKCLKLMLRAIKTSAVGYVCTTRLAPLARMIPMSNLAQETLQSSHKRSLDVSSQHIHRAAIQYVVYINRECIKTLLPIHTHFFLLLLLRLSLSLSHVIPK